MADAEPRRTSTPSADASGVGAEAVARILDIARSQLGMQVAFLAETGPTTPDRPAPASIRFTDGPAGSFPLLAGGPALDALCAQVLNAEVPAIVPDVGAEAGYPKGGDPSVGAFAAVPVTLSDGTPFGVIGALSHEPDPLLRDADAGMVRVLSRAVARLIEQHGLTAPAARQAAIQRIRAILEGTGLSMVFQSIVDLDSRMTLGYEALARFGAQPERSPDRWFAEAARVDLGADLELAAVRAALSHIELLPVGAFLSVNASTPTVASPAFLAAVRSVPAGKLVVELTDHIHIEDDRALGKALATLGMAGVQIATDVSDAGFETLSHLLQLTPDIIKLDGLLVRGIDTDPVRRVLGQTIVAFAGEIGASVVGESIQTDAELAMLKAIGVRSGQGRLLAPPGPLVGRG